MFSHIRRVRLHYLLSADNDHRYLECDRYDKCLSKVAKRHWVSFSCKKCSKYRKVKNES